MDQERTFAPSQQIAWEGQCDNEVLAMPEGVVQWLDPGSGRASIVRGGREYTAAISDFEPAARHGGVRVHFDIRREHGGERAVEVTLRPGTRASHHRRGLGTLVGARRPETRGATPFERAHPEQDHALAAHPLEVARAWVDCLQTRDLDGALSLYTSDAVLHAPSEDLTGRRHVGAHLEASPLFGIERDPEIRGDDGNILVRWKSFGPEPSIEVRCRVEHGRLAEQWVGPAKPPARSVVVKGAEGFVPVDVVTSGGVDEDDIDYAVQRIGPVVSHIDDPVLFARLKLVHARDPARSKPAIAQIALDINGELVRAHVAGHNIREAADLLQRHLSDQIEQRAQHREALRTRSGIPEPGQWRHGDLPTARPDYFDRPPEERQLVRHKTFAGDELTPDEAAFDLDQLDYDFHLFRDLATGEDSVLERLAGGSFRLTRLHSTSVEPGPVAIALTIAESLLPQLTVQDAEQRLNASGERFLFFANSATGRGNVIYRRYDGHYGLITPE